MKINGTKQLYSVAHQHYDPYMRGVNMLLHDVFNPRIYGVFTKKIMNSSLNLMIKIKHTYINERC